MSASKPDPFPKAADEAASRPAMLEPWAHLTIDGLCRMASRSRPHLLAIGEAPDTGAWYHRTARVLSHGEIAACARHFALQMAALGLQRGERILLHLPNVADLAIGIIGSHMLGLLPCPVPITAGPHALRRVAEFTLARAIVTAEAFAGMQSALEAREAAAAVFSVRHVCGFGAAMPDGVVALDAWHDTGEAVLPAGPASDAGAPALVTFEAHGEALEARVRTHRQLVADALALSTLGRMSKASAIVSTIPAATQLGVVASVVLPLLTGAAIHLHGPFSSQILRDQLSFQPGAHLIAPEVLEEVLPQLIGLLPHPMGTAVLVHRHGGGQPAADTAQRADLRAPCRLIDLHALGELCVMATVRQEGERRGPLPSRLMHPAPLTLGRDLPLCEIALEEGRVQARGFGVATPLDEVPPAGAEMWRETGLRGLPGGGGITIAEEQPAASPSEMTPADSAPSDRPPSDRAA